MQLTFLLRNEKQNLDGTVPIQFVATFNGERIRKNMNGIKVLPKHWKKERIRPNSKGEPYNYHIEYNQILDEFSDKVHSIFRYFHLNQIKPSKALFEQKLADKSFGENSLAPQFFESFSEFIESGRTTKALGTIKKYKTVKGFLRQFQTFTSYPLHFDTINMEFYEKFRDYCFEERDTLNNYFGKLVAIIKTFMNWSFERGYHQNLEFKKFKRTEDRIEVIYLTQEELMRLYNFKFHSKKLDMIRDFYCFGCFTGLRYSDIKHLSSSNIYDNHIKINVVKTRKIDQTIPLNIYAKSILEKYKDSIHEPLPAYSNQKVNEHIKTCCKRANIITPTTTTRYIGQKRVDVTLPKYKLITSHTARKTFITLSLMLGMKEAVIKEISNHSDERSFKRYVDVSESFKQKEMENTWNKISATLN
ncbi:tyrosine-type recombinase/integrase [Flagellimonas sp.]|uniref:site-specific integrase n=1 Tax=Flagellimonas sp. TaxID=2058762 RepID=UPI003BA9D894